MPHRSLKVSGVSDTVRAALVQSKSRTRVPRSGKKTEVWNVFYANPPEKGLTGLTGITYLSFILFFDKYLLSAIQYQQRQDAYILGLAGQ